MRNFSSFELHSSVVFFGFLKSELDSFQEWSIVLGELIRVRLGSSLAVDSFVISQVLDTVFLDDADVNITSGPEIVEDTSFNSLRANIDSLELTQSVSVLAFQNRHGIQTT